MATSVGSVSCSYVKGVASGLRQRVMTWWTPGVDGQFGLLLGFNNGEFSFQAVLYDTKANVVAWKGNLEALLGTVVTITDDWGQAWTNCLVTEVSTLRRTPATQTQGAVDTRGEVLVSGKVVA